MCFREPSRFQGRDPGDQSPSLETRCRRLQLEPPGLFGKEPRFGPKKSECAAHGPLILSALASTKPLNLDFLRNGVHFWLIRAARTWGKNVPRSRLPSILQGHSASLEWAGRHNPNHKPKSHQFRARSTKQHPTSENTTQASRHKTSRENQQTGYSSSGCHHQDHGPSFPLLQILLLGMIEHDRRFRRKKEVFTMGTYSYPCLPWVLTCPFSQHN